MGINFGYDTSDTTTDADILNYSQWDPDRQYMQYLMGRSMFGNQGAATGAFFGTTSPAYYPYIWQQRTAPGYSGTPIQGAGPNDDTGGNPNGGGGQHTFRRTAATQGAQAQGGAPFGGAFGAGYTAPTTMNGQDVSHISPEARALMASQGVQARGQGNYAAGPNSRTYQGGTHLSSGMDPNPTGVGEGTSDPTGSQRDAWLRGIEADQSNRSNSPFDVGGAHTGATQAGDAPVDWSGNGNSAAQGAAQSRDAMAQQGFTQDGAGRWRNAQTGEVVDESGNSIAGTSSYAGSGGDLPSGFGVSQADYQAALNARAAGGGQQQSGGGMMSAFSASSTADPSGGGQMSTQGATTQGDPTRVVEPRPPGGGPPAPSGPPPPTAYSLTQPGPLIELHGPGDQPRQAPGSNVWGQGGADANRDLAGGRMFGHYADMVDHPEMDQATSNALDQEGMGATRSSFAGMRGQIDRRAATTNNSAGRVAAMASLGRDEGAALGQQGRQNAIAKTQYRDNREQQGLQGLGGLYQGETGYMANLFAQRAGLSNKPLTTRSITHGHGNVAASNMGANMSFM
jgi:hypothetical protein